MTPKDTTNLFATNLFTVYQALLGRIFLTPCILEIKGAAFPISIFSLFLLCIIVGHVVPCIA
jgi:hypothetical protein